MGPIRFLLLCASLCLLASPGHAQFIWQQEIGQSTYDETTEDMVRVSDGCVLAGRSMLRNTGADQGLFLSKVTFQGDTVWTRKLRFRRTQVFYTQSIIEDRAGNLVVSAIAFAGNAAPSKGLLIKLSASGDTLWTRTLLGSGSTNSAMSRLVLGHDGTYVVLASISGMPSLLKYSPTGVLLWGLPFAYDATRLGYLQNLVAVPGGYLVVSAPNLGSLPSKFIRTDEVGNRLSERTGSFQYPNRLLLDSGGDLLFVGGDLIKMTLQGAVLWQYPYAQHRIGLNRVVETPAGNYLSLGERSNSQNNDLAFVLLDRNGNRLRDTLLFNFSGHEAGAGITLTPANNYLVTGWAENGPIGGADQVAFVYRNWDRHLLTSTRLPAAQRHVQAYPNPTMDHVTLTHPGSIPLTGFWVLCDLQGRTLRTGTVSKQQTDVPLTDLPIGLYWLRFTEQHSGTQTLQVVKQ